MAAEKRNAYVVLSLIVAMTIGVATLRSLELLLTPSQPSRSGNTLLMASSGRPVDVAVDVAASEADAGSLAFEPDESVCLVYADRFSWSEERGPRVRLVIIGSADERIGDSQKASLRDALRSIGSSISVRFAVAGTEGNPNVPPQTDELRKFLARKGFIR